MSTRRLPLCLDRSREGRLPASMAILDSTSPEGAARCCSSTETLGPLLLPSKEEQECREARSPPLVPSESARRCSSYSVLHPLLLHFEEEQSGATREPARLRLAA